MKWPSVNVWNKIGVPPWHHRPPWKKDYLIWTKDFLVESYSPRSWCDVGAGTGAFSLWAKDHWDSLTVLEPDERNVNGLKHLCEENGISDVPSVERVPVTVDHPLQGSFGLVIALNWTYVYPLKEIFESLLYGLEDNGTFVVDVMLPSADPVNYPNRCDNPHELFSGVGLDIVAVSNTMAADRVVVVADKREST